MANGIDWFRWHHGSVTDPKFALIARKANARLGDVIAVWAYLLESASASTARGSFGEVDCEAIDCMLGMDEGGTEAILEAMKARALIDGGVVLSWEKRQPKREDETAADRKRRQREREHEMQTASGVTDEVSRTVTHGHDREEKRREEQIPSLLTQAPAPLTPSGPQLALVEPKPKGPPDCPHLAVLALWAEVLPSMPQHLVSQWKGARADHLRARWRETAAEKAWADEAQGLAYLRKLFAYVGQSPFLTGKASQRDPTKRPFVIELEWLVNPANWAKVHEGKYHQESA